MYKKYRYLLNWGLAFDEDRILSKMSELAKDGWILKEMSVFRYKFEKDKPQDLVYSIDHQSIIGNEDEYFQLFEGANWHHNCSYGPIHIFSALNGTVPIYTDKESYIEKYKIAQNIFFKLMCISLAAAILLVTIYLSLGNKKINDLLLIPIGLAFAILLPSIMVTIVLFIRVNRSSNRFKNK